MRETAVPYVEPVTAAAWWTVGAAALPGGVGTVVLAAGLGVAAAVVVALRRRPSAPLHPGLRSRSLRLLVVTVVLVAAGSAALGATGWGELGVPLACAVVGGAVIALSSLLDERVLLVAGGLLLVLGAAGALLALDSAGRLYPQGVVGLAAGAVLWGAGLVRTGLLDELRARR